MLALKTYNDIGFRLIGISDLFLQAKKSRLTENDRLTERDLQYGT